MQKAIKILHLEDTISDAEIIQRGLKQSGLPFEYKLAENKEEFLESLEGFCPDLILSDHMLPSFSSTDALDILEESGLKIPFILVSGRMPEEFLVSMMKQGASDYLMKDRLQRLPNAIVNALEKSAAAKEKEKHFREIERQERKFRALIENITDGIVLIDRDGVMVYHSPSVSRITGYTPEEATGKGILDFFHPVDARRGMKHIQEVLQNAAIPVHNNFRIRHKNGHYLWVEGTISNLLSDESVNAIVINYRDITDRRLSEQMIQKSEANLRNLLENTDTAYVLLDRNACILSYNRLAAQLAMEELSHGLQTGQNYVDTIPEFRREAVRSAIELVLSERRRISYETRYVNPDGSEKWITVSMHPIFNRNKQVLGLSIGATNITERKKAEESLKKSEGYLRTMFDNTLVSYVFADKEFNLVAFNRTAETGYQKELNAILKVGENLISYLPPARRTQALERYQRALNGEKVNYEISFPQDDGGLQWYNVNILPMEDNNGVLLGLIIASENITERKNSEIEREKMISYITHRNQDLEQFAYIISHNLRSPVANITGLINMVLDDPDMSAEDYQRCMSGLAQSVKKLDEVIVDLNHILQVRQEIDHKKEDVDLAELVADIKASISNLLEKDDISIVTAFSGTGRLFTVKSYVNSIFYNLISNSIKYRNNTRQAVIKISTKQTEDKTIIIFEDNGLGIDLEVHGRKLFGLYKKFHTNIEGKGMGLYLVKTQVEILGGNISVASIVGSGTTFTIQLPVS